MTNERIVELASLAVATYTAEVAEMGASNATPFAVWISKCADLIPEIALDKLARKIFTRKATEFFARAH